VKRPEAPGLQGPGAPVDSNFRTPVRVSEALPEETRNAKFLASWLSDSRRPGEILKRTRTQCLIIRKRAECRAARATRHQLEVAGARVVASQGLVVYVVRQAARPVLWWPVLP
jgi:hypothetical protein